MIAQANQDGQAEFTITDKLLTLSGSRSLIGRSVVVDENVDVADDSAVEVPGSPVACGVIGRTDWEVADVAIIVFFSFPNRRIFCWCRFVFLSLLFLHPPVLFGSRVRARPWLAAGGPVQRENLTRNGYHYLACSEFVAVHSKSLSEKCARTWRVSFFVLSIPSWIRLRSLAWNTCCCRLTLASVIASRKLHTLTAALIRVPFHLFLVARRGLQPWFHKIRP